MYMHLASTAHVRRKHALAAVIPAKPGPTLQGNHREEFQRIVYLSILYKEAQESLRNSLPGAPYDSLGADGGKERYL